MRTRGSMTTKVLPVRKENNNQTDPAREIMVLIALATSDGSGDIKYGSRRRV